MQRIYHSLIKIIDNEKLVNFVCEAKSKKEVEDYIFEQIKNVEYISSIKRLYIEKEK